MKQQFYSLEETPCYLEVLNKESMGCEQEPEKHQLVYEFEEEGKIWLRLPLQMDFTSLTPINGFQYVVVLVESGLAVVGFFEDDTLMEHKVFRAYTVRKKQGKSQIKHLKTKGKSRAGSRLRLASTLDFFEDINMRLTAIFKNYRIDKICLSCSKTLWPYFFNGKVVPPFEKNDPRLLKVPYHVPSSNFDHLIRIQDLLYKGDVRYKTENEHNIVDNIKQKLNSEFPNGENDDW